MDTKNINLTPFGNFDEFGENALTNTSEKQSGTIDEIEKCKLKALDDFQWCEQYLTTELVKIGGWCAIVPGMKALDKTVELFNTKQLGACGAGIAYLESTYKPVCVANHAKQAAMCD